VLDVMAAMATAQACIAGAKKAVGMAQDIEGIIVQLGKWAKVADELNAWATKEESKPPIFRALKFGDATSEALNAVAVKAKLAAQEKEIRELLQWHGPPGAYQDFIAERRRIRTAQQRQLYLQAQRRKAFLVNAGFVAALAVLLGALAWLVMLLIEMIGSR